MSHTNTTACLFNRKPIYIYCRYPVVLAQISYKCLEGKVSLHTASIHVNCFQINIFCNRRMCVDTKKFVVHSHLPLLVSRRKFFLKSNSQPDVSWHPLSMTDVSDLRHESPNLLEIIFRSGSQIPSFTYPSDMVCVDPDVGDGVLWTRGRLSSEARNKPMVSRFTCWLKQYILWVLL